MEEEEKMIIDIDVSKMTPEQLKKLRENQEEVMRVMADIFFIDCKAAVYGVDVRERRLGDE